MNIGEKLELISVIIPVYNVERYLRECLDSVINQTYKNLEIILVDDGSTDNCPQICDEYAGRDDRVKVIHKQNDGAGFARNAGLDAMTGEYIAFVDSDDHISADMYEVLLGNLKAAGADVSVCRISAFYKDQAIRLLDDNKLIVIDPKARPLTAAEKYIHFSACNKLYKKHVFDNLRYNGIYAEDMYIYPQIVYNAGNYVITNRNMYFYRQRGSSAWRGKPDARLSEFIQTAWYVHDFIAEKCPDDLPVARYMLYNHHCHVMNLMQTAGGCKGLPLYRETRRYLKRQAWQIIRQKRTPRRTKQKALCFWLNENLYARLWRKHYKKNENKGYFE
jgi:glycosyltransferase involved in cell wall biosynthesis